MRWGSLLRRRGGGERTLRELKLYTFVAGLTQRIHSLAHGPLARGRWLDEIVYKMGACQLVPAGNDVVAQRRKKLRTAKGTLTPARFRGPKGYHEVRWGTGKTHGRQDSYEQGTHRRGRTQIAASPASAGRGTVAVRDRSRRPSSRRRGALRARYRPRICTRRCVRARGDGDYVPLISANSK